MMKFVRNVSVAFVAVLCVVVAPSTGAETHANFQSVDANGASDWAGGHPVTLVGVILNNPEDMLDATYDADAYANGAMGGEWQLFVQGISGDWGGTALWMGQNYYSRVPVGDPAARCYDQQTWASEMLRLNYDETTGHQFRQGDLVVVTANTSLFYGGKRNVNEAHSTSTDNNFSISLMTADYGLPAASEITLSDLYVPTDSAEYDAAHPMFDQTRQTGAEYYQGTYVHLTGITLTDSSGWGQTAWGDRTCTVTDGQGRTFALRMPLSDLGEIPVGEFDAYGIINQESESRTEGRVGYELFVTSVTPEPASLSLLAVAAVGLLRRRR